MIETQNLFQASLLAGAIGDALGYPVEFKTLNEIEAKYGQDGITNLDIDDRIGKAIFSDDTQMTLFTADGLLWSQQQCNDRDRREYVISKVYQSYLRWYYTQERIMPKPKYNEFLKKQPYEGSKSILDYVELYEKRVPGNSCLLSLASGEKGTVDTAINKSKGCGGVMRVAPVGLFFNKDPEFAFRIASEVAAITHGHPAGWLTAGTFAVIIAELINGNSILDSIKTACKILDKNSNYEETLNKLLQALYLANSDKNSKEAICQIGEGWIAEEALAIAVYCALKEKDFKKALIMSVNHDGDSDSTGSICGNILGATYGIKAIPKEWIDKIELKEFIYGISDRLYNMSKI